MKGKNSEKEFEVGRKIGTKVKHQWMRLSKEKPLKISKPHVPKVCFILLTKIKNLRVEISTLINI